VSGPPCATARRVEESGPDLIDAIAAHCDAIAPPRRLPFVMVASDHRRAGNIRHMRGVLDVAEIDGTSARIIGGIDAVLDFACPSATTIIPPPEGEAVERPLWRPDLDPPIQFDPAVRLPARLAAPAALNLSWGVSPSKPFLPNDPVNVATRLAARTLPVVIALGNFSKGVTETASAWAAAQCVISVGATDSATGGVLLDSSSRGNPSQPGTGPTVVAYGASALDDSVRGTSFAAPRVAAELLVLAGWCLTLRHLLASARGGVLEAIPLVGHGVVDQGESIRDTHTRATGPGHCRPQVSILKR